MRRSFYYIETNGNPLVIMETPDENEQAQIMNCNDEFPCCDNDWYDLSITQRQMRCMWFLIGIADNMYNASWDVAIVDNIEAFWAEVNSDPRNYKVMAYLHVGFGS